MSELWVDPEGLRRSATGFTDGSKQLKTIYDRLHERLSAEGRCWGGDETGQQFEGDYLDPSQDVLNLFADLAKGVADMKTGLDKMADVYEKVEARATQNVKGVWR